MSDDVYAITELDTGSIAEKLANEHCGYYKEK